MTATAERGQTASITALAAAGVALMLAGGVWWAFDANPSVGKIELVAGLIVLVVALALRGRLAATGRKWALAVAILVFAFAAFELWQAVLTIDAQRSAFPA